MVLAGMISTDEDALTCDLAETYGIFDFRSLPARTVATLAAGLREDSRIKMKLRGEKTDIKTTLLASIVDRLGLLVWFQTKDGANNINRPPSVLAALLGVQKNEDDVMVFVSGEDFEEERKRLISGGVTWERN